MESEQAKHAAPSELPADAGIWLTITDLAKRTETSKASVSERVAKFASAGLLQTRPGKGKAKLVNLAQYEAAIEQAGEPAKEQSAETKAEAADEATARDPSFRIAATKEKEHQAQLAAIKVGKELGRYIEIEQIKPAIEEAAEVLLRIVDRALGKAAALDAAARAGGVNAVRAALREINREQRTAIAEAMQSLADTPLNQPAPLPDEFAEAPEPELPLAATDPAPQAEPEAEACNSNSDTPPAQ